MQSLHHRELISARNISQISTVLADGSLCTLSRTGKVQLTPVYTQQELDSIRRNSMTQHQVQAGIRRALDSIDNIQKAHARQQIELKVEGF